MQCPQMSEEGTRFAGGTDDCDLLCGCCKLSSAGAETFLTAEPSYTLFEIDSQTSQNLSGWPCTHFVANGDFELTLLSVSFSSVRITAVHHHAPLIEWTKPNQGFLSAGRHSTS